MLVKEIFCACGRVLKLVLWGVRGVFAQMNVGLAGGLSFSFVLSGVSMLLDVSRETRRFYNNPFVSRETQGGVVKLRVMVFENSFSCRC